MKKAVSVSLAAALLLASAPATFAKTSIDVDTKISVYDKGSKDHVNKGKGNEQKEVNQEEKKDKESAQTKLTDEDSDSTNAPVSEEARAAISAIVKEAVKTKKQLIELRQQLKKAQKITAELNAEYEELVKSLEGISDLGQAIEVQKELLRRAYQKGDRKHFAKLGELYEKSGVKGLKAFVNGMEPQFDQPPFIQGGRALVPIRAISEALKADVKWDPATRSVVITRGETKIILYLDKKEALVGDKTVTLDAVPVIKKGRLFLPLRFVSENLQATVDWQPKGQIIIIDDNATTTGTATTSDNSTTTTGTATTTGNSTTTTGTATTSDNSATTTGTATSTDNSTTTTGTATTSDNSATTTQQ